MWITLPGPFAVTDSRGTNDFEVSAGHTIINSEHVTAISLHPDRTTVTVHLASGTLPPFQIADEETAFKLMQVFHDTEFNFCGLRD